MYTDDKSHSFYSLNNVKSNRYESLDGLRAYAAIGIVMMHVLANVVVKPNENFLTDVIIPFFTNFTLLFMVVSAFSVCCGYYDRVKNGTMRPNDFYKKRYRRLLPFFALMVIISLAKDHDYKALCESFANLTLCFNLLPNPSIETIGVGWFIGTVFTFYLLFPFFTFLLDNKKRGWFVLVVLLIFCLIAIDYFSGPEFVVKKIDRVNIIYSAPFFIAGGLIYLYRDSICKVVSRYSWTVLVICLLVTALRFIYRGASFGFVVFDLALFSVWLIYAVGTNTWALNNRFTKYISKISLEIYLCHMMAFRVVEKVHLENMIGNKDLLYVLTFLITLIGAIVFSHVVKFYLFPRTIDKWWK